MEKNLKISQLRAIKQAAYLGKKIKKEFPEIAQDYRNGLSKSKIVEKYDFESIYDIRNNVAQNAVALALRGYTGYLRVEAYPGLIKNQNELEQLASEHQAIAFNSLTPEQRKNNGKKVYELGLGVHGYTPKQRTKIGRKGGIIARDNKYGFHAFTPKQKAEQQRKAMIASGKTPYTIEEKGRIFELADDSNFQEGKKGPSYNKIKQQINIEFHEGAEIRTRSSINYVLFRG